MICKQCGNMNNFLVFKGEVIYIVGGNEAQRDNTQIRAMCNECFSCEIELESKDKFLSEVAA